MESQTRQNREVLGGLQLPAETQDPDLIRLYGAELDANRRMLVDIERSLISSTTSPPAGTALDPLTRL